MAMTGFYHPRSNEGNTNRFHRLLKMILWCNEFLYYYFMLVALFLNMSLCHDLVQLLKSPFNVAKQRLNLYYISSFTIPFIIVLAIMTKSG